MCFFIIFDQRNSTTNNLKITVNPPKYDNPALLRFTELPPLIALGIVPLELKFRAPLINFNCLNCGSIATLGTNQRYNTGTGAHIEHVPAITQPYPSG